MDRPPPVSVHHPVRRAAQAGGIGRGGTHRNFLPMSAPSQTRRNTSSAASIHSGCLRKCIALVTIHNVTKLRASGGCSQSLPRRWGQGGHPRSVTRGQDWPFGCGAIKLKNCSVVCRGFPQQQARHRRQTRPSPLSSGRRLHCRLARQKVNVNCPEKAPTDTPHASSAIKTAVLEAGAESRPGPAAGYQSTRLKPTLSTLRRRL